MGNLQSKYPSSPRKSEYEFYEKISILRSALSDSNVDPQKGLDDLAQFTQDHKGAVDSSNNVYVAGDSRSCHCLTTRARFGVLPSVSCSAAVSYRRLSSVIRHTLSLN